MSQINTQRSTVLTIVNDVLRRMNYPTVASLSANKTTLRALGFLNDVVTHISDYGDWPQEFSEVVVTAPACALTIEINASAPIKRIREIHVKGRVAPLLPVEIEDIRRLQRTSAHGTPTQFALVDASGINPRIRIHQRVATNTAKEFNVACYTAPLVYSSSDASKIPPWSSRLMIEGLWASMLLDENGMVPTPQYQAAFTVFTNRLSEEYRRWSTDTGQDIYLVPARGRRGQ